jgi:hypothetical protein
MFQVYDQLNALAQKNPWFVQSLQKIMTAAVDDDGGNRVAAAKLPVGVESSAAPFPVGGDPAQAALILLLAGQSSEADFLS